MGHENLGVVEEVGSAVRQLRKGDRVVLSFNIACGTCSDCSRGYTSACLVANDEAAGAAYGYVSGPYAGGQAEFLRAPWAEANCIKLPGSPVAIFGASPVGLLAAYSSMLRGAAEVHVVDAVPERLEKARGIGAIPIDFRKGHPADQIRSLRLGNPLVRAGRARRRARASTSPPPGARPARSHAAPVRTPLPGQAPPAANRGSSARIGMRSMMNRKSAIPSVTSVTETAISIQLGT